jgi:hypothetical protein
MKQRGNSSSLAHRIFLLKVRETGEDGKWSTYGDNGSSASWRNLQGLTTRGSDTRELRQQGEEYNQVSVIQLIILSKNNL